jgi:hypothetical protein
MDQDARDEVDGHDDSTAIPAAGLGGIKEDEHRAAVDAFSRLAVALEANVIEAEARAEDEADESGLLFAYDEGRWTLREASVPEPAGNRVALESRPWQPSSI